jgi:hypothetical protein
MPNKTPENAFLARLRGRKSTRSNLWLVYSHKIRSDLILESNQELAHWLLYLEFEPSIVNFWIPGANELYADQRGGRKTRPDVIATNASGGLEWHEVKAGYVEENTVSEQIIAQRQMAADNGATYRLFDESTRLTHRYELMPRLRLMHFVAVTRSQSIDHVRQALLNYVSEAQSGTVGEMLQANPVLSPTHLIAALIQLSIEGRVTLDIEQTTPTRQTRWSARASL